MNLVKQGFNTLGTKLAIGGWLAFAGTHLGLSSDYVRPNLVKFFGTEQRYRMFYSAVSLSIAAPVIYRYRRLTPAEKGPILIDRYKRKSWWKFSSAVFRILGATLIGDAFMTPIKSPFGVNTYLHNIEPTSKLERDVCFVC